MRNNGHLPSPHNSYLLKLESLSGTKEECNSQIPHGNPRFQLNLEKKQKVYSNKYPNTLDLGPDSWIDMTSGIKLPGIKFQVTRFSFPLYILATQPYH